MEAAAPDIAKFLIGMGFQGIVFLVMIYVVRELFRLYRDAQEARIEEGKALVRSLDAFTTTLQALADAIRSR